MRVVMAAALGRDSFIRTIQGANTGEKLNWIPTRCIIYGWIQDLIDEVSPDTILDNLESLTLELKIRKKFIKILVCELVPTLRLDGTDDTVTRFSNKLRE